VRAKPEGHSTALVHQQEEGIFWYVWKHRLYALGVEELPFFMARAEGCTVILEVVASKDLWI
jgi:hypothetical protein